jgi:putative phage-type endonuclease
MATYEEVESFSSARMGGVGGSDVAAIVGLSPYRRPIDVWESKVRPEQVPELDKECLWFGNALEPVIRGRYAIRNEIEVVEPSEIGKYFPNSKAWNNQTIVVGRYPWMLGTADGWAPALVEGVEIKNIGRKTDEWGEPDTDEIPAMYCVQTHWYIDIHSAKGWRVAPLFSGNTLGSYRIPRDEQLMKDLRDAVGDFWTSYVVPKKEPPIDESENYGKYLARKFSLSTGNVIKNPSIDLVEWALKMKHADDEESAAADRKREANNHLRALVGDAKNAAIKNIGTVGWIRPEEELVTDWTAVASQLSSLYDEARAADAVTAAEIVAKHTKPKKNEPYLRAWWSR